MSKTAQFHVVSGDGTGDRPIYVDPAIDPMAIAPIISSLRPGDRVLAGPRPGAWWERLLPWKAREVYALERIATVLELGLDRER